MSVIDIIGNLFTSDLRMATPILLSALGLLIMNRAGLVNIGCEGIMLISTFIAVAGTYYTHNVWLGMLCAMVVAGLLGPSSPSSPSPCGPTRLWWAWPSTPWVPV